MFSGICHGGGGYYTNSGAISPSPNDALPVTYVKRFLCPNGNGEETKTSKDHRGLARLGSACLWPQAGGCINCQINSRK